MPSGWKKATIKVRPRETGKEDNWSDLHDTNCTTRIYNAQVVTQPRSLAAYDGVRRLAGRSYSGRVNVLWSWVNVCLWPHALVRHHRSRHVSYCTSPHSPQPTISTPSPLYLCPLSLYLFGVRYATAGMLGRHLHRPPSLQVSSCGLVVCMVSLRSSALLVSTYMQTSPAPVSLGRNRSLALL